MSNNTNGSKSLISKMTREEAILRILTTNEKIDQLVQQGSQIQARAQQQCMALQNEANNLIGRNEQMIELFGIDVKELQELANAREKSRADAPPPTSQAKRRQDREAAKVVDIKPRA